MLTFIFVPFDFLFTPFVRFDASELGYLWCWPQHRSLTIPSSTLFWLLGTGKPFIFFLSVCHRWFGGTTGASKKGATSFQDLNTTGCLSLLIVNLLSFRRLNRTDFTKVLRKLLRLSDPVGQTARLTIIPGTPALSPAIVVREMAIKA